MAPATQDPQNASSNAAETWRRRAVEATTQRLALKGTAVLLAVVLWFIVSGKEPTEDLVPVRFAPQLDSSLVLRDPPAPVRALVIGTGRDLLKLYATPPVIKRPISANAPDTLVVDLRPSDVELPPGSDAIVRDVQPRAVTLRFEPTSTRVVPVHSAIQMTVDSGAAVPEMAVRLDPDSVEVSGPRQRVLGLRYVTTTKTSIPATDSLPHLVDIDTAQLGVRVKPAQVKVHLTPVAPLVAPARVDTAADSTRGDARRRPGGGTHAARSRS
ncbi:MAG TPA: hypothetical protein VJU87_02060 [Gemmatimonadaceae bacterium]|nr:hypothetical protein [Gemmatimonadaceae bacterium]